MCVKCDHIREGLEKYSVLANEDMSKIAVLDSEVPNFAVEINTKDMSLLARVKVSEDKESNFTIDKDTSEKDEIILMMNIVISGVSPIDAVNLLSFSKFLSERIDIEKSLDSTLELSDLFEEDSFENQLMQSTTIH